MSTIVTTLLLIVATGVIGSFLVYWANASFAFQSLNISNEAADRINLIKESYVVEDVWFKTNPPNTADVTIRNTGDLAITVSRIYVNNTQVPTTGQTITIGNYAAIEIPVVWVSDHSQLITVQTERGTVVQQIWKS